jgi:WXXGXW repeat (2 copies)
MGKTLRTMLLSLVIAGGISSGSVLARAIIVEIAPPAPRVEVIPEQRRGYTWAPGYWGWQNNKHVWVNGRSMRSRAGYQWAPDHWNEVNGRHQYEAGHWARDQHG